MSKYGSIKVVLASAAVIALAGCGTPTSTLPSVLSGDSSSGTPAATASGDKAVGNKALGNKALGNGVRSHTSAGSSSIPVSAAGTSIPFPVAVGDTWVYQTRSNVTGGSGTTTNRIVAAGPTPVGYRVAMASTSDVGGATASSEPVFYFHADGTIAYPVTQVGGISVQGSVLWPDAAGLLYGYVYHSVLRVQVSTGGSDQYENADVTVQGAGTTSVTVPAGTYSALLVKMTFSLKLGNVTTTTVISNWLAASAGPVKTVQAVSAGGKTQLVTTSELLRFGKGFSQADGS
jgi:hypothetical protein